MLYNSLFDLNTNEFKSQNDKKNVKKKQNNNWQWFMKRIGPVNTFI